jgi:L-ribulose-5-phosphate 3-epimerase UlaE
METLAREIGYISLVFHAPEEYCSIDELDERIVRGNWKRKESILITKLLYWLEDTPT